MASTTNKMLPSPQQPETMATFDPILVHRVLLTDPSEFSSLTVTGEEHSDTPSFEEFVNSLKRAHAEGQPPRSTEVEATMKRAFKDHVCQVVVDNSDMKPLQRLMLELHEAMRALVPNRSDLHHSILSDENVTLTLTPFELLPLLVRAAQALGQLESPVRSKTTKAWVEATREMNLSDMELCPAVDYLVISLLYLLRKAELCEQDKQDFYLSTVWAPRIHAEGIQYERYSFEARFGRMQEHATAPLTRDWIRSLVAAEAPSNVRNELCVSRTAREQLLKRGWIENILFRCEDQMSVALPEILALDVNNISTIRGATRRAAAGSALALHACNAAGVGASVLAEKMDPSSPIYLRQKGILKAVANRQACKTLEEYESSVASQVVALAREWNKSLSEETEDLLKSRTVSVMRAKDPVIQLLDGRMKDAFSLLVTRNETGAPTNMRSGRESETKSLSPSLLLQAAAHDEFAKRGLSFYASDLAKASVLAKKVIDLAWKIFGDAFLDQLIKEECATND